MAHVRFWLIMLVWVPLGCAHPPTFADPIQAINEHPRITYQSLLPVASTLSMERATERDTSPSPVVCPSAETKVEAMSLPTPPPPVVQAVAPLFVPFGQDQFHVATDFLEWQTVLARLETTGHYVVVGYAHAQETNAPQLAQRRAEYIAGLLAHEDFPPTHIRLLASWDQDAAPRGASQGVHIFPVGPGADVQNVVLRVATQP